MSDVYLLGAGSIGGLIATQLSRVSKSPITLLLSSETKLASFLNHGSTIRYKNLVQIRNPIIQDFQFKAMSSIPKSYTGKPQPIQNLVVSTKCHQTLDAISKLIPCLNKNSNVFFIQNGIGVAELILDNFYPISDEAPNFYQGVINHGVFRKTPFEINHVGLGDLKIAKMQIEGQQPETIDSLQEVPIVVQDLILCDMLNTRYIPYKELLLYQYEKLIVNACINPLTSVLDCTNGELLPLYQTQPIFNKIIKEAVKVILAIAPKNLQQDPTLQRVLDHDRLLVVALNVAKTTRYNSSSMREDVRHLQNMEIDFINGYISKRGKEHDIFTPYNKMMTDLAKLKLQLNINRNEQAVKMSV